MRNDAEDYETSDFVAKMVYLGDHYTNGNAQVGDSSGTQRSNLNDDTEISIDEQKVLINTK